MMKVNRFVAILVALLAAIGALQVEASIKAGDVTVYVGETTTVSLASAYASTLRVSTVSSYRWSTSNSSVFTVQSQSTTSCVIKGQSVSSARLEFYASYWIDGYYRTMDFYYDVTVKSLGPTGISLSSTSLTLTEGGYGYLTAYLTGGSGSVSWSSSDTSVATVSYTGTSATVSAISAGTATIRATTNTGYSATCYVTVNPSGPTGISVSPSTVTMAVGGTQSLTATLTGGSGTVTWTSGNTAVATVSGSGKSATVTGVGQGITTIRATTNTGYSSTCQVTVKPAPTAISLPASATVDVDKTVTITPTITPSGAAATLTWTTGDAAIAQVSSTGVVTGKRGGTTTITVKTDNGLTASCKVAVVKTKLPNVTISPNGGRVEAGTAVSLSCPTSGATIYYTTNGGAPSTSSNKYTSSIIIEQACTIKAMAVKDAYDNSDVSSAAFTIAGETYRGDVNNDGIVDVGDVNSVLAFILGDLSSGNEQLFDINNDGGVDVGDVNLILDIILGNEQPEPVAETGTWLEVVTYNSEVKSKPFLKLTDTSKNIFTSFVSNSGSDNGATLYLAVEQALDDLAKAPVPADLSSVTLLMLTRRPDFGSLMLSENYGSDEEYLEALSARIKSMRVGGLPVDAYAVGLKTGQVSDESAYRDMLAALSTGSNSTMASTQAAFSFALSDISSRLNSQSRYNNLAITMPGISNGRKVRFTFDAVADPSSSTCYIQGDFSLKSRQLTNVTSAGFKEQIAETLQGEQNGLYINFKLEKLHRSDNAAISPASMKMWTSADGTQWSANNDFKNTDVVVETDYDSRIVIVVLDMSSADGLNEIKSAANAFIANLAESVNVYMVNGVSFTMVAIKGGTFWMGATSEQGSDYDSNERPIHQVTLSDYWIGETEVTEGLWTAVMGSNPSANKKGDNYPVECVTWNDCQTFISKLNSLTGETFRLPTEAEWEFAARGGTASQGYKYSGSNTIGDVAWYTDNSGSAKHPVAMKAANELGLYDMSGNVWEWCQDWYSRSYYSGSPTTNPTGPSTGSNRVFRGGGWLGSARGCRVSYRLQNTPSNRLNYLGLRLAR